LRDPLFDMPPEVVLPNIARYMLEFLSQPETMQLLKILTMAYDYCRHQMEAGNLAPMDPRLLMLTLQGPILTVVFMRDVLGLELMRGVTNEELIATVTGSVLPGLLARKQ
jgi:hypothetical protein